MYTIKFGSQWVDESIDEVGDSSAGIAARHATSNYIDAVTYTVFDGSGQPYGDPITVEKGDTLAYPATPGSIRVPAGTYTIRQTSYTLANGEVVSTAAPEEGEANNYQFAAYAVTNHQNTGSGECEVTVGTGTSAPVEVRFTNTRSQFHVTVQTKWLPEGHELQYNGDIPYKLSYTALKTEGTEYKVEKQSIPGTNTAAGSWTATHDHIPTHSVNGQETLCDVDPNTLDALSANYDTESEGVVEGGNYTFTITNTLKQGPIMVHVSWELFESENPPASIDVTVSGYGIDGTVGDGRSVTLTLNEDNSWIGHVKGYLNYPYTVSEVVPTNYVAKANMWQGDDTTVVDTVLAGQTISAS